MNIDLASVFWAVLSIFIISLALALFYLYLKDRDLRKLMVTIGILPSAFSFLYLGVKFPPEIQPENTVTYFIFRWGMIPILISIFFILVDRLFYRKKDFKIAFYIFLFFYLLSFVLILSNIVNTVIYLGSIQFLSLFIIVLSVYLILKVKIFSSWLFLFSICCFTLGGFSINIYMNEPEHFSNTALTLFSFFLGFVFLGLIFGYNVFFQRVDKDGIGIYFSLENKLKKAEEALQESQQRYRQVVENLHQGIFIIDKNATTTYINSFFVEMLGYTPLEMSGKNIFEYMDINSKNILKRILNAQTDGLLEEYELNFLKKDKTVLTTMIYITPFLDSNNKNIGMLAAVQDISNRKRMEYEIREKLTQLQKSEFATLNIMEDLQGTIVDLQKAKEEINRKHIEVQRINQELNAARNQLALLNQGLEAKVKERTAEVEMLLKQKDEFISQLGHDLKTPLTPLNALLPLMRQQEHDTKIQELLDVCINNVQYMKNLVIRTLELAQLNSPTTVLNIDDVSLIDEVNEVLKGKLLVFVDNNITVNNNIKNNLIVQADSILLKELFDNIIVNAVKYSTKEEHLNITVDAKEEQDQVVIAIKDTGIGMSSEQLANIFHEFYKADSSRHSLDSTGLGLSICKRIVEKHGGKIWAESPGLGKGSTFYFSLPLLKKKTA
jgi:PAS domain S-box-containing protein